MDGYTVDEAAEVLGIPGKRVWELITSGVLAASSEGRFGMRVFLQARTTTEMGSTGSGEPRGAEVTPFRELLTEFRNLTERYGQALLALGEARGEVSSLRARVELLETRIDVRHAPARIAPVGSWPSAPSIAHDAEEAGLDEISGLAPAAAEQEAGLDEISGLDDLSAEALVDGAPSQDSQAAAVPEKPDGHSRRRGRSRSGHSTLADIPAALARAEDPNAAELREAKQAAALAAESDAAAQAAAEAPPETQQVGDGEPVSDEGAWVPDGESAEPDMPLFDEASRYTTAIEEPDWIVEEDLWRSAAQAGNPESPEAGDDGELQPAPSEAQLTPGPGELEASAEVEEEASTASGPDQPAEADLEQPSWVAAEAELLAEPSTSEPEAEPAPSTTADAEAQPAPSTTADLGGAPEAPRIDAITADVAFSIGESEPDGPQIAAEAGDEAEEPSDEPPGDLDSFMAAADLGSPPSSEPDYAAELEHSGAGWHSVIAPTEEPGEEQESAAWVEPREPDTQGGETAPAEAEALASAPNESDGSPADSWDASEMEAIRALLARANAIDREQLEVEASSHPLDPGREESVREIVASGAATDPGNVVEEPGPDMPEVPNGEELIVDPAASEAPALEEPPYSLSPHLELPGSDDLGEAMAAFEAISAEPEPDGPQPDTAASARAAPLWPEAERRVWSGSPEPWGDSPPTIEPEPPSEEATSGGAAEEVLTHLDFGAPMSSPRPITTDRSESASAVSPGGDGEWLEPRDSAASRAFRRLRRIFPG